eukprot:scaffold1863_cov85-Cylindrotheca_fusiformis.AAC.10
MWAFNALVPCQAPVHQMRVYQSTEPSWRNYYQQTCSFRLEACAKHGPVFCIGRVKSTIGDLMLVSSWAESCKIIR